MMNNSRKKPAEGFLMINVDASYDAAVGVGSTGAVIRDAAGGFIAAAHSYIPHVVDAAMVEARLPLRTVSCWLNRLAATEWKYKLIAWKS